MIFISPINEEAEVAEWLSELISDFKGRPLYFYGPKF